MKGMRSECNVTRKRLKEAPKVLSEFWGLKKVLVVVKGGRGF
jgi:hypothetical protein